MTDIRDQLDNLFSDAIETRKNEIAIKDEDKRKNTDEEYEYAQAKLFKFIEQAENVLSEAGSVAESTGSPDSFKAYAQILKEMRGLAKDVMIAKKIKKDTEILDSKLKGNDESKEHSPTTVTNNTVVVNGNINDVLKAMKEKTIDVQPIQE